MAKVLSNGIDIPVQWIEVVGRTFGVVQREDETAVEALVRLDDAMFNHLKRVVIQTHKRELAEAQADADNIITKGV